MAKIRILSPSERKAFQSPPVFQADEKAIYFEMTDAIKKVIDAIRSPYRKVGFILQCGYFRRVGRFFSPSLFHKQDIIFVSQLLTIDHRTITFEMYKEHRLTQDQQKIMEILGFQSFDQHAEAKLLLSQEVTRLVAKQIRPKMIIYHLSAFFFQKKIETPSYQKLAETIIPVMEHFETQLLSTLESNLTKQHMKELDQLLPKIDPKKALKKEAYYARAPLVALREFPLSSRPGKIRGSIHGFLTIKKLFQSTHAVLQSLALSPNSLKYYAVWVQKAITQLMQINNPYKRYLYLLTFIAHQYYYRQDLLVDTLLQIVQSVLNRIEKKQEEEDKNTKNEKERATQLLSKSYRDKTDLLTKIQAVIHADYLSADEKVKQIQWLMGKEDTVDPTIVACIEKLDKQIANSLTEANFYNAIEKQSLLLQNRLSGIIKHLNFNALNSTSSLLKAIDYFQETEGQIGNNPPRAFLEPRELTQVVDNKDRIHPSLYKALLFVKVANAIKSGEINLTHSYRYLSIDEYLINKVAWKCSRQDYLEHAELTAYSSVNKTMVPLQKKLDEQYHKVNESISSGQNPHISFNKEGEIMVDTPKVEKIETQRIAELLKQKNYISILDVLGSIDQITNFSECLQHYSVVQQIKRPDPVVFYAGLIGKGCNIGLGKLASVSKGINGNTLETVVNWYFNHKAPLI